MARPSATVILGLTALLLLAPEVAGQDADTAPEDALLAACRAILDAPGGTPEEVAARLASKGPDVLPCLLLLHAEGGDAGRRRAISIAIPKVAGTGLPQQLMVIATGQKSPPVRAAALEVFGEMAGPEYIPALLPLVKTTERDVRRTAERAVVKAVLRIPERALPDTLRRLHDATPQSLRLQLAECVLLASRSSSMPYLASILGPNRTLDLLVLCGLGRMSLGEECPALLESVRAFLSDPDPAFRRHAAQALGQLRDPESAGELVRLLGDQDEGVRATAWWALRNLSGLDLPADPRRWRVWYEAEHEWWEREGRALLAALESPDPAVAVEAVRLLSLSTLHRREVEGRLVDLRERGGETVRAAVEALLGPAGPGAGSPEPGSAALDWFARRASAPAPTVKDEPRSPKLPPPEVKSSGTWIVLALGGGVLLILLLRLLGISHPDRRRRKAVAPGPITMTIRYRWAKKPPVAPTTAPRSQ